MTLNYLHTKIQERVNTILRTQSSLRAIHAKMEDRIYSSSREMYIDEKLYSERQALCVEHIEQIEALEEKCGRIMRKFIEMKIQKRNNKQNNHDR